MKIRNGFVSNSSTSSFLIYGVRLEEDAYGYEELDEKVEAGPLQLHCIDGDGYYVGMEWDQVGDDETGAQFKARVTGCIGKVFGKKVAKTCATHQEAWHD